MSTYDPNRAPSSGGDLIRPYLATAGRTTSRVEGLKLETLVQHTGTRPSIRFESAKVFGMCELPISLAELSAHLSMPLGSVKVIVGDLISSGDLKAHRTVDGSSSNDVQLITRLISGVRKL